MTSDSDALPILARTAIPTVEPRDNAGEVEFVQLLDSDANPVTVYLDSLGSRDSRRTMAGVLDRLAELLAGGPVPAEAIPWHELRPDRTEHLRANLVRIYAPSTARKMLSGLSGVLKQCWRMGLMEDADYRRAIAWGKVTGSGLTGARAGRHVENGELHALFTSCANSKHQTTGARDAAVIAMCFAAGNRRSEAVAADVADYDPDTGALTVVGKGNKTRLTYLRGGAADAMDNWLVLRGPQPGPILVAVNKAGKIDPKLRRMTSNAVYAIMQRRAPAAAVKRFSPHDLRRTFAGEMLDAGADVSAVQQLMGHASASVTTMYDRRGERAKERAAGLLHVPYVAPQILPIDD